MIITSILLLSAARLSLSAPSVLDRRDESSSLRVMWQKEKTSGGVSLRLTDADNKKTFAASCANTLDVSGVKVDVLVDDNGAGNLVIGDKTYLIHSDASQSGGAVCNRIYNEHTSQVDCTIPWTGPTPPEAEVSTLPGCHHNLARSFIDMGPQSIAAGLDKRQNWQSVCSNPWHDVPKLDGNGSPRERVFCKQVTRVQQCDQKNECAVAHEKGEAFSFGAEIGAAYGWISGGFSVAYETSVSEMHQCGGSAGDRVCVWYLQPYTAYKAQAWSEPSYGCVGTPVKTGQPYEISSPIPGRGEFYCVVGTCRELNSGYWCGAES